MLKKIIIVFICILLLNGYTHAHGRGNTTNSSFNKAKRNLLERVYKGKGRTFYCGCPFKGKKLLPYDNYRPKKKNKRSKRIEWEHVVPAAHFGQSFKEWRNGHSSCVDRKGKSFKGRNCARKMATHP